MVEVSTRWNGERQRRPTGTDLGMEPRARGPSAPGMADRRLHSKERNAITVNHDVTGGLLTLLQRLLRRRPRIAMLQGMLRRLLPILLHLLHLLHRSRPESIAERQ